MPSECPRTIDVGAWLACFLPPRSRPMHTLPLQQCPRRGQAHALTPARGGVVLVPSCFSFLFLFFCFGARDVNKERNFLRLHTTLSTTDTKQNTKPVSCELVPLSQVSQAACG